jgi:hypothetical protein
VIEETILWAVTRQSKSIKELSTEAGLPHQVIIAAIARLMRFRLIEVALTDRGMSFHASEYGFKTISGGNPLPFFPKRISRRVSFVIEWATGDFFPTRQVRLMSARRLDQERKAGAEVRTITVGWSELRVGSFCTGANDDDYQQCALQQHDRQSL